jgi:glycolate dehydrogenase iron-sulfur subunit
MADAPAMDAAIERWRRELAKCIRCGTCRSVCPVFQAVGNETATARAKVKLIEAVVDGRLELTPGLQARMSRCLLCKACVSGCPSGVRTDELFLTARRELAGRNGLPLVKRLAFAGLCYRRAFELGLRMGALFQGLVLRDAPGGRGKVPRLPLPAAGLNQRRILPPLARTALRARLRRLPSLAKPRARVAFFPGCMLTYVYPEAGQAVVAVLRANGVEVAVPERLHCCGAPAFTSGDVAAAQHLAACNVAALSAPPFDAIVTGCASCGDALKHAYGLVVDDRGVRQRWAALSEKVYDVAAFLVRIGVTARPGRVEARVTYHDPCHLVRGMGVTREPRQLLGAIPGLELVEMQDAARCCGSGGTFSLSHYALSREINDVKLDRAEATGAGILATGCPACRMHIADGLGQRGSPMQVAHTAELLARAYRAGGGGEPC